MATLKTNNNQIVAKRNRIWNTKLVTEVANMIEMGDIVENPFMNNDPQWRSPDITFEYTQEEIEEIKKCASDVVYFANKYSYSMTDEGIQKITLRDYQEEALFELQKNRFNIWMASRQVGKCFLHFINITIKNKDTGEIIETTIGDLFDKISKNKRKSTFLEKIKSFLWKTYTKLS